MTISHDGCALDVSEFVEEFGKVVVGEGEILGEAFDQFLLFLTIGRHGRGPRIIIKLL